MAGRAATSIEHDKIREGNVVSTFARRQMDLLFVVAFATSALRTAAGDTLQVPSQYPTIQAAIDSSVANDLIQIANGTYTGAGNKNLDFHGKAVTLRSVSGNPALCIIDCESDGRGFYFHSGEGPDTVVEGLTVTRGASSGVRCEGYSNPTLSHCTFSSNSSAQGGGIDCYTSSPAVTNCAITGNLILWGNFGGGISCERESSPTVTNCSITNNAARYGGGLYCEDSSNPVLTACTISGNVASGSGGGVYAGWDGNAILSDCAITGNMISLGDWDAGGGAGVYSSASSLTLNNTTIAANTVTGGYWFSGGGGLYCSGGVTLRNCTIVDNISNALEGGGGLYLRGRTIMTDCLIARNTTDSRGGAIIADQADAILTNCRISGNTSTELTDGGGVGGICSFYATLTFRNCVISGNRGSIGAILTEGPGFARLTSCTIAGNTSTFVPWDGWWSLLQRGELAMSNCVLWGNAGSEAALSPRAIVSYSNVPGGWPGPGNIDVDPVFVDPGGSDASIGTDDDDLRLSEGSPCINAGSNGAVAADVTDLDADGDTEEPIPVDLDGNPRQVGCFVDMGAYEYAESVPLPGDVDDDCAVTLADFELFEICLSRSGPGGDPLFQECVDALDFDGDSDVDLTDYAKMQILFR